MAAGSIHVTKAGRSTCIRRNADGGLQVFYSFSRVKTLRGIIAGVIVKILDDGRIVRRPGDRKTDMIANYRDNETMAALRQWNVSLDYQYKDKNGDFMGEILVTPPTILNKPQPPITVSQAGMI